MQLTRQTHWTNPSLLPSSNNYQHSHHLSTIAYLTIRSATFSFTRHPYPGSDFHEFCNRLIALVPKLVPRPHALIPGYRAVNYRARAAEEIRCEFLRLSTLPATAWGRWWCARGSMVFSGLL